MTSINPHSVSSVDRAPQASSSTNSSPADSLPPASPIGRHLLADFFGVSPELLKDEARLMGHLLAALDASGFHRLSQHSHQFPDPGGVTGFVLLSESHAAFHSYPEHGYIAVDVFSCGMADPSPVIDRLTEWLAPARVQCTLTHRGEKKEGPSLPVF